MIKSHFLKFYFLLGIVFLIASIYTIYVLTVENTYLEKLNSNYKILVNNDNEDIRYLINSLDEKIYKKKYSLLVLFNEAGCNPCEERIIRQLKKLQTTRGIFLLTANEDNFTGLEGFYNIILPEKIMNRFPDKVLLIVVNNKKDIILKLSDFNVKPQIFEEDFNLLKRIFKDT